MPIKYNGLIFTAFLGALSALPPLSIDMGLPGIPTIESTFSGAAGRGALTLSLFLAGFAISPSICGPLADRFGRRPLLLVGLLFFSLGAAASAFAGSFELLLCFRLLQGIAAGTCVVLPIAIVRDLFDGTAALTRLSQVSAVIGVAPMLAPVLGGWIIAISDWRMVYLAQAAVGSTLFIVAFIAFKESLPKERRRSLAPRQLMTTYADILTDKRFVGLTFVCALGFACMFSYISGSASVLMGELNLSETTFSMLFAITSCGILFGSLLNGGLNKKQIPSYKIINVGLVAMGCSAGLLLLLIAIGMVNILVISPLVAMIIFSFGLVAPNAGHEALQNLGHVAGSASGLMRGVQMLFGAVASALIAALEPTGNPALNMAGLMCAFILLTGGAYLWVMRAEQASLRAPAE